MSGIVDILSRWIILKHCCRDVRRGRCWNLSEIERTDRETGQRDQMTRIEAHTSYYWFYFFAYDSGG